MLNVLFQKLLVIFGQREHATVGPIRAGMSAEGKLFLTIWCLANNETFQQVGDHFGISRGYSHYLLKQCANVIAHLSQEHGIIKWPSSTDIDELVSEYNFPGGFAAVDRCHVPIKVPLQHADSYINRKSFASVVLQATCTKIFSSLTSVLVGPDLFTMQEYTEKANYINF